MMRDVPSGRRAWRLLAPMAMLLVLVSVGTSNAQKPDRSDHAKMLRAKWMEPSDSHTIPPHGTITTIQYGKRAITKLPPAEEIKGDLTMTVLIELDTAEGTKAPFLYEQRSGILTITPSPEDVKDDIIQPSAIEGTTAKVRIDVTAHGARLGILQPVYYEQVEIWLPGQKDKVARMEWIWKPSGKHDDPER